MICRISYIIIFLFFTKPTFARFLDDDANEVDREDLLNTENFNDEISYRPPFGWRRMWERHDFGLRMNGGSYNAYRFMYEEDIKLRSSLENPLTFSFRQERQQNLLENANDREIRVRFNQMKPFVPAIMADTDSYKRSADLGGSLMFTNDQSYRFESYYWAANYLYNQKRGDTKNMVQKPSRTIGGIISVRPVSDVHVHLRAEHDQPFIWDRISDGYLYKYEKSRIDSAVSYGSLEEGWFQELSFNCVKKHESKNFYLSDDRRLEKALELHASIVEYQINYAAPGGYDLTQGLVYIERNADYTYTSENLDQINLETAPEKFSPDVKRREQGYYVTYYVPAAKSPRFGYQFGLFVNNVFLVEAPSEKNRTEIKGQSAMVYQFANDIAGYFNGTWNLDGVVHDYPYKEKKFRPWDGGSMQFIAMF